MTELRRVPQAYRVPVPGPVERYRTMRAKYPSSAWLALLPIRPFLCRDSGTGQACGVGVRVGRHAYILLR